MCLTKGHEKQNIGKIYSECFRRKTLTSGIDSDIITFADEKSAKHWKRNLKKLKKVLDNKMKIW